MQKALGPATPTVAGWKGSLSLEFAIYEICLGFELELHSSASVFSTTTFICLPVYLPQNSAGCKGINDDLIEIRTKEKSTITYSVD